MRGRAALGLSLTLLSGGPRLAASNFLNPRRPPEHGNSPNIGYNRTAIRRKDGLGEEPCARSVLFCSVSQ